MKYLSDWQALNVVSERGFIADWHPFSYFRDGNAFVNRSNYENKRTWYR